MKVKSFSRGCDVQQKFDQKKESEDMVEVNTLDMEAREKWHGVRLQDLPGFLLLSPASKLKFKLRYVPQDE
jgi:hypothetical protein